MKRVLVGAVVVLFALQAPLAQSEQASEVAYRLTFPEPEHRWMEVEVTFPNVPRDRPLELRMSRSSPGTVRGPRVREERVRAARVRPKGTELATTRPDPYQWDVPVHDGAVRVRYRIYGDHADGTYFAVDTTHAHLNMPAALLWARGFDDRPARVRFEPPRNSALARRDAALSHRRRPDLHRAEPAVPARQPRRARGADAARVQRHRARRPRRALPHRAAPHRLGCRRGRAGGGRAESRARAGRRLRRVSGLRAGHVHVPARLSAVGRRRRHGAPEQHGHHQPALDGERHAAAGGARDDLARAVSRLERRAHQACDRSSRSTSRKPTCRPSSGSPKASPATTGRW